MNLTTIETPRAEAIEKFRDSLVELRDTARQMDLSRAAGAIALASILLMAAVALGTIAVAAVVDLLSSDSEQERE